MRPMWVLLCVAIMGVPSLASADDLQDVLFEAARKGLANAKVAEGPSSEGRRSPAGPQLYRKLVDSVVLVVTKESIGSGVVVTPKGHMLTNWHVVGSNKVVGVVARSRELLRGLDQLKKEHVVLATVIATDARRDLAILAVEKLPTSLRPVPLGESDGVEVGQDVVSIGHPRGLLWSYTEGVVSQVRPDYQWTYESGSKHQATVIQTQTPTHPGSSGGALFDGSGRVVGVNYGGKDPTLSFAISVGEVRDWIQDLARR
jgi:putative serine protease PepD